MPSQTNWMAAHHGAKNLPLTSLAERYLEERELQTTGKSWYRLVERIEKVSINGASVNLTQQVPAGARVVFCSTYFVGAIALTTATKIGVGIAGTPSAFLLSTAVMADTTTNDQACADAAAVRPAAAQTTVVSAVDNSGAAAGTAIGTVIVRTLYEYVTPIAANAA